MIDQEQFTRIAAFLPILRQADPQMVREFYQGAYYVRIPTGRDMFAEDDRVDAIAVLVSGVVRVYKVGETGREITLYRFGTGESCVLTANAILSNQSFSAIATVEQDAEAIMIPANIFRDWVHRYNPWLNFVLDLLSERLSSMMEIVDEVVFRRMDIRVATFLLEHSWAQNPLNMTHQEIAAELGSSREVISRILENLTRQGLIRMGRGTIEITDSQSLQTFAFR
ncbi:MAG: Crp/Fnr family transcriptional regulator [Aggregatilineales bacterium]